MKIGALKKIFLSTLLLNNAIPLYADAHAKVYIPHDIKKSFEEICSQAPDVAGMYQALMVDDMQCAKYLAVQEFMRQLLCIAQAQLDNVLLEKLMNYQNALDNGDAIVRETPTHEGVKISCPLMEKEIARTSAMQLFRSILNNDEIGAKAPPIPVPDYLLVKKRLVVGTAAEPGEIIVNGNEEISGNLTVTGTINSSSTANSFQTDSGTATPSGGVLKILGGTDLETSGSGNTVTVAITAPISVPSGGTGDTSFTAYAPVCGGTTTTGALQSASTGMDTSGFVLTSNGAASLPTFQVPAASSITITGDTGVGLTGNSFIFTGGTTGLKFNGTAGPNTETLGGTLVVGNGGTGATTLTAHGVLIGEGTSAITAAAPSATSGIPLVSQGAASDPIFGTAAVAGGGTGATTLTNHGVLVGQGASPITALAVGATGTVLAGSNLADPSFTSSPSVSGSVTAGTGLIATTGGLTVTAGGATINGDTNINTPAANFATSIGNTTGSSPLTERVGTGGYSLDGAAGSSYSIGASTVGGSITIGGTGQTGAINIGHPASTSAQTGSITIGGGSGIGNINIGGGGGLRNISIGSTAASVLIGGVNAPTTITAGNGSSILLNATGAAPCTIGAANQTGTITIGNSTVGNIINIGNAAGSPKTVNIATGAVANVITIGSTTGAASLAERVGTGNYSLDGAADSAYSIGASTVGGTITIGGTGQTGAITLGSSTSTNAVNIGTGASATSINIGTANTSGAIAIGGPAQTGSIHIGHISSTSASTGSIIIGGGAGTGGISIGNGSGARSINIGTSAASTITMGATTAGASVTLQAGTSGGSILINPVGTATFTVGNSTGTGTITICNSTSSCTVNIATAGSNPKAVNIATGGAANQVTIGSTTAAAQLTLSSGTVGATGGIIANGVDGVTVTGPAVMIDSGTKRLGTLVSSRRFKENIRDITQTDITQLHPVRFNYKTDEKKTLCYGLIAEEVAEIMPGLVVYDKEGQPYSVKYHELPVLLLHEIKKLHAKIEELERKNSIQK